MAVGGKGARPADWLGARPRVWGCCGLAVLLRGAVRVLWWWSVLVRGLSVSVVWSWRLGGARQTHIMERFTRCGSIALDSAAMHCLLPSAMLR